MHLAQAGAPGLQVFWSVLVAIVQHIAQHAPVSVAGPFPALGIAGAAPLPPAPPSVDGPHPASGATALPTAHDIPVPDAAMPPAEIATVGGV